MENKITGAEFGLFDYTDIDQQDRQEDVAMLFENNPFFFGWYKRTILSDTPISETYH